VAAAPVRGTQSFVEVMSSVWRRPSLTGLEIAWRWVVGGPVVAVAVWQGMRVAGSVSLDTVGLQAMTVFQPVLAFRTLDAALAVLTPAIRPVAVWLLPVAAVMWVIVAALGRTLVLRRLDATMTARPLTLLALSVLKVVSLGAVWWVWLWGFGSAVRVAITGPAARGEQPSLVVFSAMAICGTLALYAVWGVVSWPLQLAPLLAMRKDLGFVASLRQALGAGPVRGKLVEINLVMHIVKIALIVLAMVLSASPLAFTSVETQEFLVCWWSGAVVLYLAASDYFHVVRAASYLALWRAYHP